MVPERPPTPAVPHPEIPPAGAGKAEERVPGFSPLTRRYRRALRPAAGPWHTPGWLSGRRRAGVFFAEVAV